MRVFASRSFLFYIALLTYKLSLCSSNRATSPFLREPFNIYKSEICVSEFTAIKVKNEYIFTFLYYYVSKTRKKFLKAVMKNAKKCQWKIIQRSNPASIYPSDFDVVETMDVFTHNELNIFMGHPSIKSVTPHNLVKRVINYKSVADLSTFEDSVFKTSRNTNNSAEFISLISQTDRTQQSWLSGRRLLRAIPRQITTVLGVENLWDLGITGRGIKVAVFDTGLSKSHPHFRNVKERTNWTNEKSLDDGVSHGTFVAGVIASAEECLGLAPDAELHVYRVFTNTQVSYTSWFLDAFNYAIVKKINVINLSIGGPDFLDYPFVEKVLELSANKIIMVSAIGNDGPTYGTLNNPGDQSDVIGVGGINFEENVAKFSSRGMTTWELPQGYGRLKPDIVTYGSQVKGSNIKGGCRLLSGTSVASPVVAGAVTLLASGVSKRMEIVNPSSMKQVLLEGATRLAANNMFEQGHGKLNILKSMDLLAAYIPKVTLSPAYLDSSENYMWPYSSQPLYCGSEPIIANVTILNGIAVTGFISEKPSWHPYSKNHGHFLNVSITVSHILWPWCGWMAVFIAVTKHGCNYEGVANGYIKFIVQSTSAVNKNIPINSTVFFPITVKVIPKPPRHKRILWDQFHNLRYPPGYIPRDNLNIKSDPLDWKADHIHTNFREMYEHLRNSGYYIDVLRESFNCFDAADYGTILIVDPEEEYFEKEITKLQNDVYYNNLSIIIFADWYNTTVMKKIKFFDENTRQWWIPDTGGANIPALNELLKPFDIAMGDFVAEGYYSIGEHNMYYASGSVIVKFPETSGSILLGAHLHDQGFEIIKNIESVSMIKHFVPILGLLHAKDLLQTHYNYNSSILVEYNYEDITIENSRAEQSVERNPLLNKRILLKNDFKDDKYMRTFVDEYSIRKQKNYKRIENEIKKTSDPFDRNRLNTEGRIAVFGDSNCLDSSHIEKPCYWLLDMLLEFTMNSQVSNILRHFNKMSDFKSLEKNGLPLRIPTSNLHLYSKVLDSQNMGKKMPIQTCEKLIWSSENIDDINIEPQKDTTHNYKYFSKKFVRKLESENERLFYALKKDDYNGISREAYVDNIPSSIDSIESFKYSLFFIIVLTTILLCLFINRFKRRLV